MRLQNDIAIMNGSKPNVSLCAKWLPTENHALDKKTGFVKLFTSINHISRTDYRKKYLAPLRKYIDIVERQICNGEWSTIDYNSVPSCAMHKLKAAFQKHDSDRFDKWMDGLVSGSSKVNATLLYPHQIIYELCKNVATMDAVLEAQFAELIKKYQADGLFEHTLIVCDVSASMMTGKGCNSPINVCTGLGLLAAALTKAPWQGKVITFSKNPKYVDLNKSESLRMKYQTLRASEWGMNTDIQKVFDLILNTAIANGISSGDMPKRIIIISDMQFDTACSNNTFFQKGYKKMSSFAANASSVRDDGNYQAIRSKYTKFGYTLPMIVFWNVNGAYGDFPITSTDKGIMISGFSPSVLKYIFNNMMNTSLDILNEVLYDKRYNPVRQILSS
jgi:hypothetical protein